MKKSLNWFAWNGQELSDVVMQPGLTDLYIYNEVEYDLYIEPELVDFINKNNIKINVLTGGFDESWPRQSILDRGIKPELLYIEAWPSFWFKAAEFYMKQADNKFYTSNYCPDKFDYPFLSFNGRHRAHRTLLIDKLAKYKLINRGVVTYHDAALADRPWKFHNGSTLTIDDTFTVRKESYDFNEKFVKSFLHIIAETTLDAPLLSEKTSTPMLMKMPFLTIACPGFHTKYLTGMGFKLYDDIFDYEFDLVEDIDIKLELVVKNIVSILDKDLQSLYKIIKPKIDYNFNLIQEMLNDNSLIPSIAMRRMNTDLNPYFMFKNHMENRYD